MFFIVLVMLVVCIGIPLAYSWRVFRLDEPCTAAWLLLVADAGVFVLLVLILGRWDMAGYRARFLILAVFLAAVLWSLRRHLARPWLLREQPVFRERWPTMVSLVLFGGALCYVIYGVLPLRQPHELAFPLKDGRFMVGQGGGISLLNHHAAHREQRYAADIIAINQFGYRAAGLSPKALDRYVIYGVSVVSPCKGKVVGTRSDLPDLIPPDLDPTPPPRQPCHHRLWQLQRRTRSSPARQRRRCRWRSTFSRRRDRCRRQFGQHDGTSPSHTCGRSREQDRRANFVRRCGSCSQPTLCELTSNRRGAWKEALPA